MPAQEHTDVLTRITWRKAQVLRSLADSMTEREAAEALGITENGIRSHVEQLKEITGSESVRDLSRWWRANRRAWVEMMAAAAGLDLPDGAWGT